MPSGWPGRQIPNGLIPTLTHGLIAAYHLASGARPLNVTEFVDPDVLPDDCWVAAVVGDVLPSICKTITLPARYLQMVVRVAVRVAMVLLTIRL